MTWNEWDPLEEVVVGTAWGAHSPSSTDPLCGNPRGLTLGGQAFPIDFIHKVEAQIEHFVDVLKSEGVIVRRPATFDLAAPTVTPFFAARCGYNFMNMRDLVLIVGDQIIEAPTASRSRYFETLSLRPLFKEYFQAGARWVSAPKPELSSDSYNSAEARKSSIKPMTSEHEPVFDAADFVRCGVDIFGQRGARTNLFGIEWLRRFLGEQFRIHVVPTRCEHSVHIDTTFVPIGPRMALVNPAWIGPLPDIASDWEIVEAPPPEGKSQIYPGLEYETSQFIAMNVFLIDEKRIFVDAQQKKLIAMLRSRGFNPIDIPFDLPPFLGGGFHCVTLDVRRRGALQSYSS